MISVHCKVISLNSKVLSVLNCKVISVISCNGYVITLHSKVIFVYC